MQCGPKRVVVSITVVLGTHHEEDIRRGSVAGELLTMNAQNGYQAVPTALARMAARLAAAIGFQPNIERRRVHRRIAAADRATPAHTPEERRAHADRRSDNVPEFA